MDMDADFSEPVETGVERRESAVVPAGTTSDAYAWNEDERER
jgi:dihydrodipicolinate synthase/N-acetylneuraminate lyase